LIDEEFSPAGGCCHPSEGWDPAKDKYLCTECIPCYNAVINGVRFAHSFFFCWIPACAGMTHPYQTTSKPTSNTMPLWTSTTAATATSGTSTTAWEATSVSINTRTLEPGALFIALKGEQFDGHHFVADALAKGASAAVVSYRPENIPEDAPVLLVKDTEQALRDLGAYARAHTQATVIGVTGSVGKTSVKEMLGLACAALGKTYATKGNLNNHYGTPLSLAHITPDDAYAIIEMGMNHAGEIRALTTQARPHIAIITTVEPVHLEFFPSVEAIADAKAEIMEGIVPGGTVILNRDNPHYDRLRKKASGVNVLSFGEHEASDCRLIAYEEGCITARYAGKEYVYTLGIPGKHQALNSLSVLLAIAASKGNIEKALHALAAHHATSGRGAYITLPGNITLIDDCYNASVASITAALNTMPEPKNGGRKIAVLGDMLELGEQASSLHRSLATAITANRIALLFTAGARMRELYDSLPLPLQGAATPDAASLLPLLKTHIKPNDVVLIKGSNGMRLKQIVEGLAVTQES
jgi:UDP-N-acetylmuramoyl-tripeptide--D-alanyl-D-alanine ligase